MKKYLVLFFMMSAVAQAELVEIAQNATTNYDNVTIEDANSIVHVGASYSYVWITPKGHSAFQGNLGGAQASYEYKPQNSLYEGVVFAWRQGSAHQGSSTRELLDFDVHERIGYTFGGDSYLFTLFSGLGYRYLGQELQQPGLSNLSFNYNEFYIPVGFLLSGTINSYMSLGLNCTWMPQVYSAVTIIPLNGANWIIERTLTNILIEAPISFTFTENKRFSLELKPFFEYWQDGKTNAVSKFGFALDVPGNTYLFCGVQVNVGWSF